MKGITMVTNAALNLLVGDYHALVLRELATVKQSTKAGVKAKFVLVLLAPDGFEPTIIGEYFEEFVNATVEPIIGLSAKAGKVPPHGAFVACSQVTFSWSAKVINDALCQRAMQKLAQATPSSPDTRCLAGWISNGLIDSARLKALYNNEGITNLRMLIISSPVDVAALDEHVRMQPKGTPSRPFSLLGGVTKFQSVPMPGFYNHIICIS